MATANDEDKDIGLGGTGMLANSGNGLGGTGIVGEITGYGSIFVNGTEVEYDSETAFTINGETSTSQQLEIGDIVEVLTVDAKQHTQAVVINLRHEVIGVVESVEPQTSSFTVHGQRVIQSIGKSTFPEVGTTVAVSGFRMNEQTIFSTRVTPAKTGQVLLQTRTELPFNNKADKWLIQTHIQDGKATFKHDGTTHVFTLTEKTDKSSKDPLVIKILQLQKSAQEKIELNRVIDPLSIPRGQITPSPVRQSGGSMMQRQMPRSGATPTRVRSHHR